MDHKDREDLRLLLHQVADALEEELNEHFRIEIRRFDSEAPRVLIEFPSGYALQPVVLRSDEDIDGCLATIAHLRDKEGIDGIVWTADSLFIPPPVFECTEVILEGAFDHNHGFPSYFFPTCGWSGDQESLLPREVRNKLIRAAYYRSLDAWGPLSTSALIRGVGTTSASSRGSLLGGMGSARCVSRSDKGVWRLAGADIRHYSLRLSPLPECAKESIKARAKQFAAKEAPRHR